MDTICWFVDRPVARVTCRRQEGVLRARGIPTADAYITTLDFDGGAVAVIENSWILPETASVASQSQSQRQG